ncbi:MAG: undecaprenyl-diphosphate phosphatase [Muribaculaceae bacterium]|nr:undecaprenyl-diphosphate phosphatase [Muribaculaceae bacterium]MDE6612427.1 undecaprenyl-diphosphate phosphatase [Muribaculaceae bacterium]
MDVIDALILGIVQGLAEYLPVSSSGHLEIFREILGLDLSGADSLQFDVMLHVATVLSTIVVLWREFMPLCVSFFTFRRDDKFWYVCKILISCIPIGIVGVFFKETIESFFGQDLTLVGCCLCVTALLLSFSYFFRTRPLEASRLTGKVYKPRDITFADAFVIGCAQAVAVLPGLSRSGTTIATGILIGDKREQVAKFSFLMVIIPILGEALLDMKKMFGVDAAATADTAVGVLPIVVGFIASFVVGCIACKWMLAIVNKGKLVWFALYCLIVGLVCVAKGYGLF